MFTTNFIRPLMNLDAPISEPSGIFNQFNEVNRLIILGNGFDLAHGLKTSYRDFIYDYCLNFIKNVSETGRYGDKLLKIEGISSIKNPFPDSVYSSGEEALNYILSSTKGSRTINVYFKSEFFKKTTSDVQIKKWVDIEQVNFDCLKRFANRKLEINKLNEEFTFLCELTTDYLKKVSQDYINKPCDGLFAQFDEQIKKRDCMPNTIDEDMKSSSTCILNFNYTNTGLRYLSMANNSSWKHIAIHGQLEGDNITKQKPIFGYGDELNENYHSFESSSEDNFLTHMKSFKYLEFNNYRDLLEFIESNPFQVQLYGHSCGLSDRTLLNTIFENNNCISIKQFYYKQDKKDDFESKGYAISRHFKSKSSLRSKVVNKAYCEPMFQPTPVLLEKES
jgi:hypothetical protein